MNLNATDDLGRTLISHAKAGPPRPDRYVGMFYYLWLGEHGTGGPWDVTQILKEHPDAMEHPTSPPWGPAMAYHFWGEPLFGYYRSSDEWVMRRHMQMLTDAQVDVLFFDVTNNVTYKHIYLKLCVILRDLRQQGFPAPAVAFYCNPSDGGGPSLREVYRDLYQPGLFPELWFQWEGKPLIVAHPDTATSDAMRNFFTFRKPTWDHPREADTWTWCQKYPQVTSWSAGVEKEQTSVSVDVPNYSMSEGFFGEPVMGRSWHDGARDLRPDAFKHGFCFAEQWSRALKEDPKLVLVTQFNEWIAMRLGRDHFEKKHDILFRDEFDREYSRDIEPMKDGYRDNYYLQLCDAVRQYKGVEPLQTASRSWTIMLDGPLSQWDQVQPEYREYVGDVTPRDHAGYDGAGRYINNTGRNEFQVLKVAADKENVYFHAQTVQPLTPHTDRNWMLLFIDSDGNPATGWQGFNYVVNRTVIDSTTTTLQRSSGGWNWTETARLKYRAEGNRLHLAIPRVALGLTVGAAPVRLEFKWSDNMQVEGDIMDCYVNGDAAPRGRFSYLFCQVFRPASE